MTETELARVEAEAGKRWPLQASLIVHRVGALKPGRQHRAGGDGLCAPASRRFAAAEFLMDYLKTSAPFWKKERGPTAPSAGSRPAKATTAPQSAGIRANRPFRRTEAWPPGHSRRPS
jgi:molybdopterin synthase catalytic subunit